MSENLLKKLVEEYYSGRPNLAVDNASLCIFFFACSGSGKSTIRRQIVEKLHATYVCNDEVRELIAKYPEASYQGIELKTVVAKTVEKIFAEAPNKLVVFDNNIIRHYVHNDSYLNVAKANKRPVFIIGIEAAEQELKERIKARGVNVAQTLSMLPQQLQDYKTATTDIKPDWSMNIDGNIQGLFKKIACFISEHAATAQQEYTKKISKERTMIGQNATHANFSVDDLAVAKSFYVDKLGFKVHRESERDMMLESGAGTKVNIYAKPDHKAWDSTVFGIEVSSVKDAVKELADIGIEVAKLDFTDESGIMSDPEMGEAAWFTDPAGNWICISSGV